MRFEKFYYDIDGKLHEVEEVLKKSEKEYNENYFKHMYCPECRIPELRRWINVPTPHLKVKRDKKNDKEHDIKCSYYYTEAGKIQIREYFNDIKNVKNINNKLRGCIALLIRGNSGMKTTVFIDGEEKTITSKDTFTFEKSGSRLSIRRKKITKELSKEDDYNRPILFYGTVQLEWVEKPFQIEADRRYINMDLKVYSKNRINEKVSKELICTIGVLEKKYRALADNIKNIDINKTYNIAFMGEMVEGKWRNKTYNNCKLESPEYLVVEES